MATPTQLHTALELPVELFGLIVAKLPPVYRFQLRLVCKQWNIILHDPHFLGEYFHLTRHAPACFWPTEQGFALYSPETKSWHMWPISFILMEDLWYKFHGDEMFEGLGYWYKVFGRGDGLLLVESVVDDRRMLYLANPVTRSHRELTEVPSWGINILGMVFDESSKSYKIFGATYDKCQNTLYVYDSRVDYWIIIGEWNRNIGYTVGCFHLPTFHRGVLHSLITTSGQVGQRSGVHVFRFGGGMSWHLLTASMPPGLLLLSHLFEWQGHLVLVGGKSNEDDSLLSEVRIWQLDEEKDIWIEMTTMPNDLLHSFSHMGNLNFCCHSGADYVYLTSYSVQGRSLEENKFVRHFMCNLSMNSWWEVPEPHCNYKMDLSTGFFSFLFKV